MQIVENPVLNEAFNRAAVMAGVEETNEFTGTIPAEDLSNCEEGDILSFPSDMKAVHIPINGSTRKAECTYAVNQNGELRTFYPSWLRKALNVANDKGEYVKGPDGKNLRKKASGTVVKWMRDSHLVKVNDVMQVLKDYKIKISKLDPINVRVYGSTTETTSATIPTIDFEGTQPDVLK